MRVETRNLSQFFALLFVGLLTVPNLIPLNHTTAAAAVQDRNRSDVPAKQPKNRAPKRAAINRPAIASNDNCANAISVTPATTPFMDTKDTTGGTDEVGEPASTCTDQGSSAWYTFTNNTTNLVSVAVSTCASNFDTALMAYQVSAAQPCNFASFTAVACNDDSDCGDGLQSQIAFDATPGSTYKIQAGGFDSDTGSLVISINSTAIVCPDSIVNGTLGSGSPDHSFTSGLQSPARLFRDGIPSTCATPKVCPGPFGSGSFTFDAYTFSNTSGAAQCVSVFYEPNQGEPSCNVNAHAIAYLGSYSNTNLCQNYLGDVGSSDTLTFSFNVPAGMNFVIAIVANNPGSVGVGCKYKFTVRGNVCTPFDMCVQDDAKPGQFLQISSTTGKYIYRDCSKGLTLEGTGVVSTNFCKISLMDRGPIPKRPDRVVDALVNPCTGRGDATIVLPYTTKTITLRDSNMTNNNCACP